MGASAPHQPQQQATIAQRVAEQRANCVLLRSLGEDGEGMWSVTWTGTLSGLWRYLGLWIQWKLGRSTGYLLQDQVIVLWAAAGAGLAPFCTMQHRL